MLSLLLSLSTFVFITHGLPESFTVAKRDNFDRKGSAKLVTGSMVCQGFEYCGNKLPNAFSANWIGDAEDTVNWFHNAGCCPHEDRCCGYFCAKPGFGCCTSS